MTDIPYDRPGPSDVHQDGDPPCPSRERADGAPLSRHFNALLDAKLTVDSTAWDTACEAMRWQPDEEEAA